jgi:rRNA maturation endonuclease Nob1
MDKTLQYIRQLIREELTKTDKADIKSMIKKELDAELKAKLDKAVRKEVEAVFKDKATKDEIGEISKTIIKRLYKDLSYHHPYIIDRIKV